MTQTVPQLSVLDDHIEGLAAVRDFLANHPAIPPVNYIGINGDPQVWLHPYDHEDVPVVLASCVRALTDGAPVGSVRKEMGDNVKVSRQFGRVTLSVYAYRETVCEAKVVRTETVEVVDPDAPKVTVEREVIEWECKPLLALDRDPAGHYGAAEAAARSEQVPA